MRESKITMTAATASANSSPFVVDHRKNPFNVALNVNTDGSTTGWTVQYTLDNLEDITPASANWINTSISAVTVDTTAALTTPCYAVRLACNASGTDTAVLTIRQAG